MIPAGHNGWSPLTGLLQSETGSGTAGRKAISQIIGLRRAECLCSRPIVDDALPEKKNTDVETKHAAAAGAVGLANDAQDLVTLARAEKDIGNEEVPGCSTEPAA